jgi:hypothetical protein
VHWRKFGWAGRTVRRRWRKGEHEERVEEEKRKKLSSLHGLGESPIPASEEKL